MDVEESNTDKIESRRFVVAQSVDETWRQAVAKIRGNGSCGEAKLRRQEIGIRMLSSAMYAERLQKGDRMNKMR